MVVPGIWRCYSAAMPFWMDLTWVPVPSHLFLKKEESRRIAINAIGPVWDGNEVGWSLAGALCLPDFPSGVCSYLFRILYSFYGLPGGLIFRAICIEFRSKEPMAGGANSGIPAYCISSCVIALRLGLMLGNIATWAFL